MAKCAVFVNLFVVTRKCGRRPISARLNTVFEARWICSAAPLIIATSVSENRDLCITKGVVLKIKVRGVLEPARLFIGMSRTRSVARIAKAHK